MVSTSVKVVNEVSKSVLVVRVVSVIVTVIVTSAACGGGSSGFVGGRSSGIMGGGSTMLGILGGIDEGDKTVLITQEGHILVVIVVVTFIVLVDSCAFP